MRVPLSRSAVLVPTASRRSCRLLAFRLPNRLTAVAVRRPAERRAPAAVVAVAEQEELVRPAQRQIPQQRAELERPERVEVLPAALVGQAVPEDSADAVARAVVAPGAVAEAVATRCAFSGPCSGALAP